MAEPTNSKVPKIRFKGFEGEWEPASISNFILSLDAGVSVNSGERPANKSEFGVLKTSAVTNGVFEPGENKVVLAKDEKSRLKEPVCGGTIIISRMNTPALVGANAYVESSRDNLFLPDRLWAAKPRESASMRFLAVILASDKGRIELSKMSKGTSGSMKNITKPEVLALPVMLPSLPEQTQIGGYFRELNRLIGLQQRKHDKLVTLKKAMLQKMFPQPGATTPEIRFKGFSGKWVEKKLGELMPITSAARVHKNEWTRSGVPFFRTSDVVSHFKGEENEKAYISLELYEELSNKIGRIRRGDILITGGGSIGIPFLAKSDEPLYFKDADLLWLKVPESVDSPFLYTFFTSESFRRFLKSISHIGTIGHYTVEQAKSTPISLPLQTEQEKIGSYFRTLDELISKHAVQLVKLKQLKSACLEKMFV